MQTNIVYPILIGTSIYIPVPFFDDFAAAYFTKKMVSDLGRKNGIDLSKEEINIFCSIESKGCFGTLSEMIMGGLVKRILREVFFLLEIQRASHMIIHNYLYGSLMTYAFENKYYEGGDLVKAQAVHDAIMEAKRKANTRAVSSTIQSVLERSKDSSLTLQTNMMSILKDEFATYKKHIRSYAGSKITGWIPFLKNRRIFGLDAITVEDTKESRLLQVFDLSEVNSLYTDIKTIVGNVPTDQTNRLIESLKMELARRNVFPITTENG